MPTVEELQATIDALNARTAAYDVQITDLQQQLLDAQHAIDVAREDCRKQIFAAEESHNAKAKQLIADANVGLNSAQAMVDLFRRRWEAQTSTSSHWSSNPQTASLRPLGSMSLPSVRSRSRN